MGRELPTRYYLIGKDGKIVELNVSSEKLMDVVGRVDRTP